MQIRPVGVDKETDKTKIIVTFANAPTDSHVISNWLAYANWDRQCNAKSLTTGLRFPAGIAMSLYLNSARIGSEDHRASELSKWGSVPGVFEAEVKNYQNFSG
jgi:hypothetical protein